MGVKVKPGRSSETGIPYPTDGIHSPVFKRHCFILTLFNQMEISLVQQSKILNPRIV